VRAIRLVEAILPLDHHAQMLVVDDHHLHGDVLGREGGELLQVRCELGMSERPNLMGDWSSDAYITYKNTPEDLAPLPRNLATASTAMA
jgi:hypothetical protein